MKEYILKLLFLLIPLLIIAFFLQPILDSALKRSNCTANLKEWNDIFDSKINADILIQGSSRAWVHISPKLLDSTFELQSYNLGIDGYSFKMQYYRYLLYRKFNKKPRYIIQTADYTTLSKTSHLYQFEQFIPYLNDDLIREAIQGCRGIDFFDVYVPLYKYIRHKDILLSAVTNILTDTYPSNGKYKGFQAQNRVWDDSFLKFKNSHQNGYKDTIDSKTVALFDSFVKSCVKDGIQLVFINTPMYYESKRLIINKQVFDSIYYQYSQQYSIPILDYTNDSICLDSSNFYNSQHLNAKGVALFNKKFIQDIKKIIKE